MMDNVSPWFEDRVIYFLRKKPTSRASVCKHWVYWQIFYISLKFNVIEAWIKRTLFTPPNSNKISINADDFFDWFKVLFGSLIISRRNCDSLLNIIVSAPAIFRESRTELSFQLDGDDRRALPVGLNLRLPQSFLHTNFVAAWKSAADENNLFMLIIYSYV